MPAKPKKQKKPLLLNRNMRKQLEALGDSPEPMERKPKKAKKKR